MTTEYSVGDPKYTHNSTRWQMELISKMNKLSCILSSLMYRDKILLNDNVATLYPIRS